MITPEQLKEWLPLFPHILRVLLGWKNAIQQGLAQRAAGGRTVGVGVTSEIRDAFLSGDVSYGDKIRCEGYLSRYAHLILPDSFLETVFDADRIESLIKERGKVVMAASWKAAQIPVSSLPDLDIDEEEVACGFLYSKNFGGFLYDEPVNPNDDLRGVRVPFSFRPRVRIPMGSRPIPVLLPVNQYHAVLDHYVEVELRVKPIPRSLLQSMEQIYTNHFAIDLLSLFFDMSSEPIVSYVLSACDPDTTISRKKKASSLTDRMVLFVEGHIEGLPFDERIVATIADSVPFQRPTSPWTITSGDPFTQRAMFMPDNETTAFFRAPCSIGFYAQTRGHLPLSAQHRRLREKCNQFKENMRESLKLICPGSQPSFKLDFLYDFSRAIDFDESGVLSSDATYALLKQEPTLEEAVNWVSAEPKKRPLGYQLPHWEKHA